MQIIVSVLLVTFVLDEVFARREVLIEMACRSNPNLEFCKRYRRTAIWKNGGVPLPTSTTPPDAEIVQQLGEGFFSWLNPAKDDVDDQETEEMEASRRIHADIRQYCAKYKRNYESYCVEQRTVLDGILQQFCHTFKKDCKVEEKENVADGDGFFPTPRTLVSDLSSPPPAKPSPQDPKSGLKASSYCRNFYVVFEKDCVGTSGAQSEFCTSFRTSCFVATPSGTGSDSKPETAEDIDSIDEFPDPTEDVSSVSTTSAPEGQSSQSGSSTYCAKFADHFDYFCAGGTAPENKKFCASYAKNCPGKSHLKGSDTFLGGTADSEPGEGGDRSLYLFSGDKREYCGKFSVHFEFYCKGSVLNAEITAKFCPSYKSACLQSNRPSNPFAATSSKATSGATSDFEVDNTAPSRRKSKKGRRIKKRRPCTADCDQRIFPHCTQDCKCDYAYPAVQKFCNPPPLPLFLNTCRLWYNGCPKYERYHYASQFVYSKAEKGKVIEGPKSQQQQRFNVLSPTGEALPVNPQRWKRGSDLVDWPDAPTKKSLPEHEDVGKHTSMLVWLRDDPEANGKKSEPTSAGLQGDLVVPPPLPHNKLAKDVVPVVPSDSVFSNALSQYNGLTDTRGVLHRPRSRSPFTKPGLWEPNPDNPHNRDHANKYYYHPQSVNVDWLSGQLAWGAHWAVPAAGVGGTDGFSAVHFPTIGTFLNIPDDYD